MDLVKRIWYLSPMRAAKIQASLRIRAVSPEPPLLAHTGSESSGTFRQKARSLAPLNGWACAVKICHDGMLEDTNSLDGAHINLVKLQPCAWLTHYGMLLTVIIWHRYPNFANMIMYFPHCDYQLAWADKRKSCYLNRERLLCLGATLRYHA